MYERNKELLNELEEKFKEIKRELGFKSTLNDLDRIFFIRDFILEKGYVSHKFSRQLCFRICETYASWLKHLHNIILPNKQTFQPLTNLPKLLNIFPSFK